MFERKKVLVTGRVPLSTQPWEKRIECICPSLELFIPILVLGEYNYCGRDQVGHLSEYMYCCCNILYK